MAAGGRGAAGHMNLAELSRALPGDKQARGSTRVDADGSAGARGSLLRPAASADALHDAAAGAEPANGHQHDSAPVSRASSTNSAILQGDCIRHTKACRIVACSQPCSGMPTDELLSCHWVGCRGNVNNRKEAYCCNVAGSPGIRPTHRPIQTPPKTPRMANSNGDALPPLTFEQANGSSEHANGLAEPGADNPLVMMLLQQVTAIR